MYLSNPVATVATVAVKFVSDLRKSALISGKRFAFGSDHARSRCDYGDHGDSFPSPRCHPERSASIQPPFPNSRARSRRIYVFVPTSLRPLRPLR
jgi:hypothetical protein